ncbi:carbohydrate kinase [Amycolatopsis sp. NPDC049868]|uniref:carbohydrate kinase n=1 Tax=Amycolatopsis sp. NPDC049868 TaxID=3363934 RepID=UPI0037975E90
MIVVCGEALVDLVPCASASATNEALRPLCPRLGGSPYNVAVALGRLDVPVRFLSRLSVDPFGDAMIRQLGEATVDTSLVQRSAEPTALAVVGLEPDGSARYTFHLAGTADRLVADPGQLSADVHALSFGSVSLVLEPAASVYEAVLHREAESGKLIMLDPNVRSMLIPDADEYRRRFESWLPDVGLLKLSVEDAQWLGGMQDPVLAARRWQRQGPAAVVLTCGTDGLTAVFGSGELVHVPSVTVNVVDTIGAGDTVQAALLAWLDRHDRLSAQGLGELAADDWVDALRFAATAAGITCTRSGAESPRPTEIQQYQNVLDWAAQA